MAELTGDGVRGDGEALFKRLQPSRAVGVPKYFCANFPGTSPRGPGDLVHLLADVGDHPPRPGGREEQASELLVRPSVSLQDPMKLRVQGHGSEAGERLESSVLVRAKRDGVALERDVQLRIPFWSETVRQVVVESLRPLCA